MTSQLDAAEGREIVARWCALAERRLEYLTAMYETGRWRRYFSERGFIENVRESKAAVEAWHNLLSREASPDNRPIDFSWLDRRRSPAPQGEIWCDPVHLAKAEEIARDAGRHETIVLDGDVALDADDAFSVEASEESTTPPAPDLTTIAQRYPLLHNAL